MLATVTHHSHSKVGTANDAPRGQRTVTSTRVGLAEYYELSSDDGRPTGEGERPEALLEPWPQGKLLRHAGVGYEIVQSLDVPALQMVEQLPSVLQFFATHLPVVAEQAIDVPKISQDRTPQRLEDCLRQPQMADQLVDVPTVVCYSSLQQLTAEQIVDISAPGCAGGGGVEVFKVFSQDRIQQRSTSSKPLTFQFRAVEVFKALAQDRVHQPLHLARVLRMRLGKGFFRTFPLWKKVRIGSALGVGTECGL